MTQKILRLLSVLLLVFSLSIQVQAKTNDQDDIMRVWDYIQKVIDGQEGDMVKYTQILKKYPYYEVAYELSFVLVQYFKNVFEDPRRELNPQLVRTFLETLRVVANHEYSDVLMRLFILADDVFKTSPHQGVWMDDLAPLFTKVIDELKTKNEELPMLFGEKKVDPSEIDVEPPFISHFLIAPFQY